MVDLDLALTPVIAVFAADILLQVIHLENHGRTGPIQRTQPLLVFQIGNGAVVQISALDIFQNSRGVGLHGFGDGDSVHACILKKGRITQSLGHNIHHGLQSPAVVQGVHDPVSCVVKTIVLIMHEGKRAQRSFGCDVTGDQKPVAVGLLTDPDRQGDILQKQGIQGQRIRSRFRQQRGPHDVKTVVQTLAWKCEGCKNLCTHNIRASRISHNTFGHIRRFLKISA